MSIAPGWYIILYHDVSWEDSICSRAIGGCCPPDLFERQVDELQKLGPIVSIDEGAEAVRRGAVREPMFSLWFDDGLRGVYRNAFPLLQHYGLTAAVSVCSAFVARKELFWRYQLGFLAHVDGLRHLRGRLRKHGYRLPDSVKRFTCQSFSLAIRDEIRQLFEAATAPEFRADAHRLFLDSTEVAALRSASWTIANHSHRHYPMSPAFGPKPFVEDFLRCEAFLDTDGGSDFWVLPFGIPKSPADLDEYSGSVGDRFLVFVGNRGNVPGTQPDRVLYRVDAPISEQPLRTRLMGLA
jgi:peptidoglycan/xylan/chitin deacetylase (PgdA/CDA1 family)